MSSKRIPTDYNLRDCYKHYKKLSDDPVDYQTYKKTVEGINKKMMEAIIKESLEIKLPCRLGKLSIIKWKPHPYDKDGNFVKERLKIDFKASKEYWKKEYPNLTMKEIYEIPNKTKIYHENYHSDGYEFRFYWEKYSISNIPGRAAYCFIPTRSNRRLLAKWSKNPLKKNDYYTI